MANKTMTRREKIAFEMISALLDRLEDVDENYYSLDLVAEADDVLKILDRQED